jgi:hypothetical protein
MRDSNVSNSHLGVCLSLRTSKTFRSRTPPFPFHDRLVNEAMRRMNFSAGPLRVAAATVAAGATIRAADSDRSSKRQRSLFCCHESLLPVCKSLSDGTAIGDPNVERCANVGGELRQGIDCKRAAGRRWRQHSEAVPVADTKPVTDVPAPAAAVGIAWLLSQFSGAGISMRSPAARSGFVNPSPTDSYTSPQSNSIYIAFG